MLSAKSSLSNTELVPHWTDTRTHRIQSNILYSSGYDESRISIIQGQQMIHMDVPDRSLTAAMV